MQLYSLVETAKMLGKSRQWVWILVQIGRLKAKKVGNLWVVCEEDLNQFKSDNHIVPALVEKTE